MFVILATIAVVSLAIAAQRFRCMSLPSTHFVGFRSVVPRAFDSIRARVAKLFQSRRSGDKVAKLLTDEVGKCFVCLNVPRMPTKLRTGCACSVYGCNPCVYEYIKSGGPHQCPTCRREVFYADCPPGARYDNQIGLWRINDSIRRDLRPFESKCHRCDDFDDGTQMGLNIHINRDCAHFKVKCYECGQMVHRGALRKHKELYCKIGQIVCECGWSFVGSIASGQTAYDVHLITACRLYSLNVRSLVFEDD